MLWKTWDFAHLCSGQFCTVSLEFVLPESSADSSCHSTWSSLFLWYCCLPAPNCNFTNQRRWDCWSKDMLGLLRWRLIKSNSAARSDKAFVAGCQFLLIFGIFQIPYFPEWKNSKDSNKNKKNSSFNRNRLQSSSVWVPHWLVFYQSSSCIFGIWPFNSGSKSETYWRDQKKTATCFSIAWNSPSSKVSRMFTTQR